MNLIIDASLLKGLNINHINANHLNFIQHH